MEHKKRYDGVAVNNEVIGIVNIIPILVIDIKVTLGKSKMAVKEGCNGKDIGILKPKLRNRDLERSGDLV